MNRFEFVYISGALYPGRALFSGDEKSALFTGDQRPGLLPRPYFIRSLTLPTQTTLLGTLRYLLLPYKRASFFAYSPAEREANNQAVGRESLDLCRKEPQSFGDLTSISPLFLMQGERIYVPTPKDHRSGCGDYYSPIQAAEFTTVQTSAGEKWITSAYHAKEGLTSSWMSIEDGSLIAAKELFHPVEQVGINRSLNEGGLFQRQFIRLAAGWSFAIYVTLKKKPAHFPGLATMGQSKSLFHVSWKLVEESAPRKLKEQILSYLLPSTVYCFGDTLAQPSIYDSCWYCAGALRDYRGFTTGQNGHIQKGTCLYKLFSAGSLFRPRDSERFLQAVTQLNLLQAGLNIILCRK